MYEKAASCYYQARLMIDAVRCYRLAGAYRRAADLNAALGEYREAAVDYERSAMPELAAWLLAHREEDPQAARAVLTGLRVVPEPGPGRQQYWRQSDSRSLRHRLVLQRCDIAEGALPSAILLLMAEVCAALADPTVLYDRFVEEWAVAVAEKAPRYDQAALIFAASVRGLRPGAVERWTGWAARVLGTKLVLPTAPEAALQRKAG